MTLKLIPSGFIERNRQKALGLWKDEKPGKWYYAIPVVVFWIILIAVTLIFIHKKV